MRRRRRQWGIVAAIALIILVAQFSFFNPVRDVARRFVAAPTSVVRHLSQKINSSFGLIRSVNDLAKENAELKAALNQKEADIAKLATVQNENTSLRQDLNFSQGRTDIKLIPATVSEFSPFGNYQTLTIDKGSHDGLKENMAVVSQGFLIGELKNVSDATSEVWLLTNSGLVVPVRLTGSQTTGILKGSLRGLIVDNIPADTSVTVGEAVVTSDLGNLFPAGIAVGKVEEIISKKEEVFQTARISSPINTSSLSTVFIVRP